MRSWQHRTLAREVQTRPWLAPEFRRISLGIAGLRGLAIRLGKVPQTSKAL